MTITLTSELETAIAEQARQKGTPPEQIVLEGLRTLFVPAALTPDETLGPAGQVYAGLSEQEVAEVEKIALTQSHQGIALKNYGINPVQAAELRASLASFADEWNQPEMDVYDDYEAAKVRLTVNF